MHVKKNLGVSGAQIAHEQCNAAANKESGILGYLGRSIISRLREIIIILYWLYHTWNTAFNSGCHILRNDKGKENFWFSLLL